jgi:hypothetical protein
MALPFDRRARLLLVAVVTGIRKRIQHVAVTVETSDGDRLVANVETVQSPWPGSAVPVRSARLSFARRENGILAQVWFVADERQERVLLDLPDDGSDERVVDTIVSACACTMHGRARAYQGMELDALLATYGPHITNMCEEISIAESLWCHRYEATPRCLGVHPTTVEPDDPTSKFRTVRVGRCHECLSQFAEGAPRDTLVYIPRFYGHAAGTTAEIVHAYISRHVDKSNRRKTKPSILSLFPRLGRETKRQRRARLA